ncbi:MAG TPA: sulfatase-like hydrolase/transferase, partial [Chitinophagaceae bacterium]|nr:sulfatase-like hydrolase/transferase [Chitinophagaceae bacterium]
MNKFFLLALVAVLSGCFGKQHSASNTSKVVADKPAAPNIIVIMTDQQNATMLSCTGNKWLKTPALDALAARGVRFEKAYATNPVCLPSRFSIQTGAFPSAIGVRENDRHIDDAHVSILEQLRQHALGNIFRNAGYDTYYGGKVHLPPQIQNPLPWGYELLSKDVRGELAQTASDFLLS